MFSNMGSPIQIFETLAITPHNRVALSFSCSFQKNFAASFTHIRRNPRSAESRKSVDQKNSERMVRLRTIHFLARIPAPLPCAVHRQSRIASCGQLRNSQLDPDAKHPILLPRDSPFSNLVLNDVFHSRTLHGGTQLRLAVLRQ